MRDVKKPYLEITFRKGRAVAAYLYLGGGMAGEKSHRTARMKPGLIVDFNRKGDPIGIEITAPGKITVGALNATLRALGMPRMRKADLAPLVAA
jgi:hypothetical protein